MSENFNAHIFPRKRRTSQKPFAWKSKIKLPRLSFAELPTLLHETVLFALFGFLLARAEVLGSLLPFGPAYFAALVCCDRKQAAIQAVPIMAGLLTVASGQELVGNAAVIGILMLVFLFYTVDPNRQWVAVPALVLTSIIVAKGVTLFFGHASDYLIMVTVFESLFAAGLSLVFLVVIGAIRNRRFLDRLGADEIVCVFVFLLGTIMGLGTWSIGNVELRSMFSRLLVMLAAFLGGGGAGAGIGALVGVVPSLSEMVAPSIIGMYAFSGLLAGAFNGFGRIGVVMGFFLGNLLLALYLLNASLILAALTASAAAAVLFFLVPQPWLAKAGQIFNYSIDWSVKGQKNDGVQRLVLQKLRGMSKIFDELAYTIEQLSSEAELGEEHNISSILNRVSARVCQDCTLQKMCWEKDFYQTYRCVMSLFASIEANGYASVKDMPPTLRKRCSHAKEMLAAINCLFELYQKSYYWQRYMENTRNLVANQLTGSAQIMDKLVKEVKNSGRNRDQLEINLTKALTKKSFFVDRVTVTGMGEKTLDLSLELASCPGVDDCRRILPPVVSRLTGNEYEIFQSNCSVDTGVKTCCFRMLTAGSYKLNLGKCQIAKDEDNICGDSSGSILLPEGKQIIMLSDGMGVGAKAALESGTTLALLEQLLETGFNQEVAINTINSVLMLRSKDESFATLDLCIVDLYSGETDFIKIGGSPSLIKNKDGVKVVRASSLPIGILHTVEMETIRESVAPGDIIVLASDGLLDTGRKIEDAEQWMAGILEKSTERDPNRLAESLVKNAVSLAGGKPRDDITVVVVVIED